MKVPPKVLTHPRAAENLMGSEQHQPCQKNIPALSAHPRSGWESSVQGGEGQSDGRKKRERGAGRKQPWEGGEELLPGLISQMNSRSCLALCVPAQALLLALQAGSWPQPRCASTSCSPNSLWLCRTCRRLSQGEALPSLPQKNNPKNQTGELGSPQAAFVTRRDPTAGSPIWWLLSWQEERGSSSTRAAQSLTRSILGLMAAPQQNNPNSNY